MEIIPVPFGFTVDKHRAFAVEKPMEVYTSFGRVTAQPGDTIVVTKSNLKWLELYVVVPQAKAAKKS